MGENNKRDFSASGSARLDGGEYGSIRVSGSAHGTGNITCDKLRVSGSAHFEGDMLAGECHVSGSAHIGGALKSGSAHVSGSCRVGGDVEAEDIHVSGSMSAEGSMRGATGKFSGGVNVAGDAEFEALSISGSIHCDKLLSADKLRISLGGRSKTRDIGGDEITVERGSNNLGLLASLFKVMQGSLIAQSIEGTSVRLEYTQADAVRGKDVIIGPGCDIKRVEYENSLQIADDASVGEQVKI